MAGAMTFTACSSDSILEGNLEKNEEAQSETPLIPMTFTALQEGQEGTRTAIDGLKINWSEGDKITIFDGSEMYGGGNEFILESGAGSTSATFSGEAAPAPNPAEESVNGFYYALYPYATNFSSTKRIPTEEDAVAAAGSKEKLDYYYECAIYVDGTFWEEAIREQMTREEVSEDNQNVIVAYFQKYETYIYTPGVSCGGGGIWSVNLPSEQKATPGSADPKAMIMIARSDDTHNLQFKNVCAYVKVTPQFRCYAIRLTSKGNEFLAGKINVYYHDGEPTTGIPEEKAATNQVTLVGNMEANTDYYIAVRPESLKSGFNIEFLSLTDGVYCARSTDKPLELTRGHVMNLGKFIDAQSKYPWTIFSYLYGVDGDTRWMLVTPTLKLALPESDIDFKYPSVPFAEVPDRSEEGWELPTSEELEAACREGIFTYNESSNMTTIQGAGILRYGNPTDKMGKLEDLWTSTPGGGEDHHSIVNPYSGKVEFCTKTNSRGYLYKYTR